MKVEEETNPQDEINVYLKVIKTVPLKIKRSETVSQLQTKLAKTEGADPELQKLFLHGDRLQDNKMLAEHSISGGQHPEPVPES
ncbi:uncharacterized protein A4U43_C04F1140 [Asparagus officinalis]|uniref:Ubiquitin-like domain-containing protein n=1 Tax=Asparagus officinalis TaxID=4686 RepID=A0A5P1F2T5_ASPOF|nr:uncharacterized protein A4U43_C04F1140 [Asparagus officinalis]